MNELMADACGQGYRASKLFEETGPRKGKHMHTRREILHYGLAASAAAALALKPEHSAAQALSSLQIFVPAAPGGGWDQTGARRSSSRCAPTGSSKTSEFEHAPGAGGAVGLPKFLGTKKGQGDALMVGGMVMVGALIANKSPVKMTRPDRRSPA